MRVKYALTARLCELRTKIGHHDVTRTTLAISAQHAATCSTFPDMALRARTKDLGVQFRIRAGNLNNCVTMFLRGDTSMLLCYEAESVGPLQFGPDILRGIWGTDYLIPVVGGALRYRVRDTGGIASDTPGDCLPGGELSRTSPATTASGRLACRVLAAVHLP